MNKPNRNDDSYRVNESIADFNIEQLDYSNLPASKLSFATPNTINSHLPLILFVNSLRNPINNIPDTPNFPQKGIKSKESV